jgi:hypothetical protein
VELHVNDNLLGEQSVRVGLTASINPNLVRTYNIGPYLRQGKNMLAVKARNYNPGTSYKEPGGPAGCAGFHLYGEIINIDGQRKTIISDSTWKVSPECTKGWRSADYDDRHWPAATTDKKPRILVTYPDFNRGLPGFTDYR